MTYESLHSHSRSDLAAIAKQHAIEGWHGMRKNELIEAISQVLKLSKRQKRHKTNGNSPVATRAKGRAHAVLPTNGSSPPAATNGHHHDNSPPVRNQRRLPGASRILKVADEHANGRDSFVAQCHDAYRLFVRWNITRSAMQRAEAALGYDWRRSIPIIRVYDVTSDESNGGAATWVSDVEIHGEVDNWFVPVENPPRSYQLQIGYISPSGKFFMLARSNRVTTPRPSILSIQCNVMPHVNGAASNGNGSKHAKNGRNGHVRNRSTHNGHTVGDGNFRFEIHTELLLRGITDPRSTMTLSGESIALGEDGSFSLRMPLSEGRQVIPAVTITGDGAQQRTIVLGIERSTREMEPQDLTKDC